MKKPAYPSPTGSSDPNGESPLPKQSFQSVVLGQFDNVRHILDFDLEFWLILIDITAHAAVSAAVSRPGGRHGGAVSRLQPIRLTCSRGLGQQRPLGDPESSCNGVMAVPQRP